MMLFGFLDIVIDNNYIKYKKDGEYPSFLCFYIFSNLYPSRFSSSAAPIRNITFAVRAKT